MRYSSLLVCCAIIFLDARGAAANIVANGGFESTPFVGSFDGVFPGDTTLTSWTIDGAGVVHVGTFWQHAAGNHSVELNWFNPGGISQTLATIPEKTYRLEFDIAGQVNVGGTVKELQVFWGGVLVSTQSFTVTGHSHANMGWERRTITLPATTSESTVLRFYGSGPASGDGGAGIDNVSVFLPATSFPAADFEEDFDVDGADLTRWLAGYGPSAAHTSGDADGDQDADGQDFLIWQNQLGLVEATAVPEPTTLALLVGLAPFAAGPLRARRQPTRISKS